MGTKEDGQGRYRRSMEMDGVDLSGGEGECNGHNLDLKILGGDYFLFSL